VPALPLGCGRPEPGRRERKPLRTAVVRKLLLQLHGAVRTGGALPLGKAGVGGRDARFRPQATRGVSPDRADQAHRGCRRSRRFIAGKTRFAADEACHQLSSQKASLDLLPPVLCRAHTNLRGFGHHVVPASGPHQRAQCPAVAAATKPPEGLSLHGRFLGPELGAAGAGGLNQLRGKHASSLVVVAIAVSWTLWG
jgi:hypothetical protein